MPCIRPTTALALLLGMTATAHACNLPDAESPPFTYLATDDESEAVPIRAKPDNNAEVLTTCDNQGEAAILGKDGAWYHVRLHAHMGTGSRDISGYVQAAQVSERHTYIAAGKDGKADIHLDGNSKSKVQDQVPNGTVLIEYPAGRKGDWHFVGFSGTDADLYGFIHKSQMRRPDEAAP